MRRADKCAHYSVTVGRITAAPLYPNNDVVSVSPLKYIPHLSANCRITSPSSITANKSQATISRRMVITPLLLFSTSHCFSVITPLQLPTVCRNEVRRLTYCIYESSGQDCTDLCSIVWFIVAVYFIMKFLCF